MCVEGIVLVNKKILLMRDPDRILPAHHTPLFYYFPRADSIETLVFRLRTHDVDAKLLNADGTVNECDDFTRAVPYEVMRTGPEPINRYLLVAPTNPQTQEMTRYYPKKQSKKNLGETDLKALYYSLESDDRFTGYLTGARRRTWVNR